MSKERILTGRKKYTTFYTIEDLQDNEILLKVIKEGKAIHEGNIADINYLEEYIKGKQPILQRIKKVRKDVQNNIVENHALDIVDFKTGYVFGEPIQYVHSSEGSDKNIAKLNEFMVMQNKKHFDSQLGRWLFSYGIGYRFIKMGMDKTKPFEIINIHPRKAFTIYHDGIDENEQIATVISMKKKFPHEDKPIDFYKIYTDTEIIECTNDEVLERVPNLLGIKQLVEYRINDYYMGVVEKVMGLLNLLNKITSGEIDDIEQFVQSLLVFKNTKVERAQLEALSEVGAILITDINQFKTADVRLLSQKLDHTGIKIYHNRILNAISTIAGTPKSSDKASGGDTGQAIFNRDGWNTAELKAKDDCQYFEICERQALEVIKVIFTKFNMIKALNLGKLTIKFSRNKNDNLLVKAQAIKMLHGLVEPTIAYEVSGLFNDPNEVFKKSLEYYGENFWKVELSNKINVHDEENVISQNNENVDHDNIQQNSKKDVEERG